MQKNVVDSNINILHLMETLLLATYDNDTMNETATVGVTLRLNWSFTKCIHY